MNPPQQKSEAPTMPFELTEVDVVSSKNRSLNSKHPGNIFYTDLVQRLVPRLAATPGDIIGEMRDIAETIVHAVTVERGGRFVKAPPDGEWNPTMCTVMDKKQAVAKVLHALKTAHSRQAKLATGALSGPSAKKKKPTTVKGDKPTPTSLPRPKPPPRRREATFQYQIQASPSTPIPPRTCQLIEAVCNQLVPATAHRILDDPLVSTEHSWLQSETPDERAHRLHFRLRFAGAAAVDMAPLEFASKLLKLWNAKLIVVKKERPTLERDSPLERATTPAGGNRSTSTTVAVSSANATTAVDRSGALSTSRMEAASAVQWPTTVFKPLSHVNAWDTQFPTGPFPTNDVSGVSPPRLLCIASPVPNTMLNGPSFSTGMEHPISTQTTTENAWSR
jgi:hypothetical protein